MRVVGGRGSGFEAATVADGGRDGADGNVSDDSPDLPPVATTTNDDDAKLQTQPTTKRPAPHRDVGRQRGLDVARPAKILPRKAPPAAAASRWRV